MGRPKKDPNVVVPRNAKALVWAHFGDSMDGLHAHCLLCKNANNNNIVSIKILDGSTKSLRNHIQSRHNSEWLDLVNEEKEIAAKKAQSAKNAIERSDSRNSDTSAQRNIVDVFSRLTKIDPDGVKQRNYDRKLLDFLSCSFVPFHVVDSEEFKVFVENLDRSINLKNSRTYSKQLKKYSGEILEDVQKAILDFCDSSVAVTTDLWTSRAMDHYISITTHFVDNLFRLHRWTPFCSQFTDKHTGENIQDVIDFDLEDKLDILEEIPKWGVSDNAKNMVKGIKRSILELYTCNCHTQQLAILDTFKHFHNMEHTYTMEDVSTKCGKLAAHLHRAENSRTLLFNECDKKAGGHNPNNIPLGNNTRWNSKHDCMKGVLYHEDCLLQLARRGELINEDKDGNQVNLIPTFSDFMMIKAAVGVLEKCRVTTKLFEQEKVPTVNIVMDRLYTVDSELDEFINDAENDRMSVNFAVCLRDQLNERFPKFGGNKELNCMGNYLNPTLKGIHLKETKLFEETKDLMEEKLGDWKKEGEGLDNPTEEDDSEPPKKISPTEMLKRKMKQKEEESRGIRITIRRSSVFSNSAESQSRFKQECFLYENLPDAPADINQLEWWKSHQEQFPLLSHLVRVVFAVPAASSKSERVFSVAGNMVTPKRTRLNTETVEALVVVNTNIRILREMGLKRN